MLAWLRLVRVFTQVERATAEGLRAHGLTPAQFDVIAHVGAAGSMTQQELAASLLVTKGNVTQLLDRLERCGLIERHQAGRTKRVALTECGRDVFARAVPAQEALVRERLSALTKDEQRHLLHLMRTLDRSLGGDKRPTTNDGIDLGVATAGSDMTYDVSGRRAPVSGQH